MTPAAGEAGERASVRRRSPSPFIVLQASWSAIARTAERRSRGL